ncbi:MAG: NADH-quinone oxidoreductase subunit NuoK [Sphingobacteriia bacterium]|jgi:NADH-quinone oxidoreductase subunit K|nr:NADH-quinone oxidoreductase subunit NuoK [Sphingobacteriia bacterium]
MINGISINMYLLLSTVLFIIGAIGVMARRNTIILFMCIELMLNAVNLLLVAFSTLHNDTAGQVFVFFIMAVAAAEVAVGLAILSMIYRNLKSIDSDLLSELKN